MVESLLRHKLINAQLNSFLIEYEARKMGLTTSRIDHMIMICSDENGNQALLRRAAGRGVTYAADTLCMNKDLLKRLWFRKGIPVNPWIAINTHQIDKAVGFCEKHEWNIVVKPTSCANGLNVFTEINNREQLIIACDQVNNSKFISSRYNSPYNILIEKKLDAGDYRFFVVKNRVVAVLERTRPTVTGDGHSSISELIKQKQEKRLLNPDLYSRPLVIDHVVYDKLKSQGLNMESVPQQGETIKLRGNANLSSGGESIDLTDEILAEVNALVETAVKTVPELHTCAVDVLSVDIFNTSKLGPSNLVLNEIETDAGMCIHHFPFSGKPRNVAKQILLSIFPGKVKNYPMEPDYHHDFDHHVDLVDEIAYSIKNLYYSFFEDNFNNQWSVHEK